MKIYMVVECGWDHHQNISAHSQECNAEINKEFMQEKKSGYTYVIEEFDLDES